MPVPSDWVRQLLVNLDRAGTVGHATACYVHEKGIHVDIRRQSSGARWSIWRRIDLHPRYAASPADAYGLSLMVHEVRHLQQGWIIALSVYGELDAWQHQFKFLRSLLGELWEAREGDGVISELLSLPAGWDRAVLRRARGLMRSYGGPHYRIGLLPLYPLHLELLFRVSGRRPRDSA